MGSGAALQDAKGSTMNSYVLGVGVVIFTLLMLFVVGIFILDSIAYKRELEILRRSDRQWGEDEL